MIVKRVALSFLWGGFLLAACAANNTPFPTYPYVGIDLGAGVRGELKNLGGCFQITSGEQIYLAIFPEGSNISDIGVTLPNANQGTVIRFAETYDFHGGMRPGEGSYSYNASPRNCDGIPFIVNTARMAP